MLGFAFPLQQAPQSLKACPQSDEVLVLSCEGLARFVLLKCDAALVDALKLVMEIQIPMEWRNSLPLYERFPNSVLVFANGDMPPLARLGATTTFNTTDG